MTQVASSHPIVKLGDYIQEEGTKYNISDKTKTYGILGVNNQTGIFDAYEENGSKIKQKYKKMQVGWIAYNPYRVNVGSIGIRTEEHLFEYISPAYVVFSCKTGLLPEFLFLLMKTDLFNKIIRENTTGSVRQNLNYSVLSNLQIPLPSLEEQKNIVSTYNAKIEQANIYSLCTYRINKKIEDYLHNILETNIEFDISGSFLNYVNYKDISRWDALFLLSNNNIKSKYPLATLGQCISHFLTDQNGKSLRRETYKTPEKEYIYIGMENVKKETGEIIDNVIVKGKDIKSQTIYVPSNYFLYGKLRPYLNKYWYNNIETQQEEIICSSEFFVFDIKNNINSKYFLYVLASYIVQKQIIDAMSGARMPRISEETFRSIQIPLPPLNIQNEIVEHIDVLRKEQKDLQQKNLTLRQQATEQFEQVIFE
jgi:restriction endonuclease S subunit